ncbi:hypothetical protein [Aureivirga sp. CE67]|uniref:hypothetical protein n=1 Tax=Aureivirga sp. CE67 TaxID=1788983 RepID=UPI0018C94B4A|nr:hypothetical protein [Aureivirga sp. CE67]
MKKQYSSFKEIETDLKKLKLKKDISVEEIKLMNNTINEEFKSYKFLVEIINQIRKYGLVFLIEKFVLKK